MTREEAIAELKLFKGHTFIKTEKALDMGIQALELLDTLKDRPCSVCRHRKENGCCKWDCVFDGHIGG